MFQLVNDPVTGKPRSDVIQYTDPDGLVWTVPPDHRFYQLYLDWLAAGNTVTPALVVEQLNPLDNSFGGDVWQSLTA